MPVQTAGIFFVNREGQLLVCHPTGHDFWSISKGKLEEGETDLDAAVRETWEECNIDLKSVFPFRLHRLPRVRYKHGKKELVPHVFIESIDFHSHIDLSVFELKCNTLVDEDARWNAGKPEMDDFKWVDIEEARSILHYTQAGCLDGLQELIEEHGETSKGTE